ncbi:MAG: hypothetical protein WA020_05150 [Candidatus Acidiferrales bacterium]
MSRTGKSIDALGVDQLEKVLKELVKQTKATKQLHISYRGLMKDTRQVPDHAVRLRALIEIGKLHGFYPRRGERASVDVYDCSQRPIANHGYSLKPASRHGHETPWN